MWAALAPFLPRAASRGRKREVDLREVVHAICYLTRTGCGWRMLPKDFPAGQTACWWFRSLVRRALFKTIRRHRVDA